MISLRSTALLALALLSSVSLTAPAHADGGLVGTVVLSDDLSIPDRGTLPQGSPLPDAYQRFYDDGEYVIQKADPTWDRLPQAEISGTYADARISVDARLTSDTSSRYVALSCRGQSSDDSSEYRLTVVPGSQRFDLARWDNGVESVLVPWQQSPEIAPDDGTNQLSLSCVGPVITVALNGTTVAVKTDAAYSRGQFSIGAGSFAVGSGPTEARFSTLTVTQFSAPTPVPVPTPGPRPQPSPSPGR